MPAKRRCFDRPNVTTRAAASIARNAFPFFKLPVEIRNMIYECALGWSYAMDCIAKNRCTEHSPPRRWQARWTPGILLANRQFYKEAVGIAYKKPLRIRIEQPRSDIFISLCFSAFTLSHLRFVTFEIDVDRDAELAWVRHMFESCWFKTTRLLASIWHSEHDLQRLKTMVRGRKEPSPIREYQWRLWDPPGFDGYFRYICSPLKAVSPVKEVVIEGDISTSIANELKIHMEAVPGPEHRPMFGFLNRPHLAVG